MKTFINVLTEKELDIILSLPEVQIYKKQIKEQNNVYFTIPMLPENIKNKIQSVFNLNLPKDIPMRWIRGNTKPHIDRGIKMFENTHLLYITDSSGEIIVNNISYPIQKGSAYIFPENTNHETINTGDVPRLLLGPISEMGFSVGLSGIYAPGGTIALIREYNNDKQFSIDNGQNWNTLYFPCALVNTDINLGFLEINFISNITMSSVNDYFLIGTEKIKIGSSSLNNDGSCPIITVTANYFDGLIQNGTNNQDGYSNITVQNLIVDGTGYYTQISGGWFGKNYYGKGAVSNFFINCTSKGDISDNGGGIVGSFASNYNSGLSFINCSSSGNIGNGGGGITGRFSGNLGGNVFISQCFSSGIIGDQSGGICGLGCGTNNGSVTIINSFSTGTISANGGGIIGASCGGGNGYAIITNCYSKGNIGSSGGGICSVYNSNITLNNCYSTGITDTNGGGLFGTNSADCSAVFCYICGSNDFYGSTLTPPNITSSFSENNGWNTFNANTVLQGVPSSSVGQYWVSTGLNNPYELFQMGYTPYIITNISNNIVIRTYSVSLLSGAETKTAIVPGKSYTLLGISGGEPSSYGTFSINSSTGAVSTTTNTSLGTYTLTIRNTGTHTDNYNITQLVISVFKNVQKQVTGFSIKKGNKDFISMLFQL